MVTADRPTRRRYAKEAKKRRHRMSEDPTTRYALDVVTGRLLTSRAVWDACDRHLKDLKRTDLVFRPGMAQLAIDFFPTDLVHTKGRWAGTPLVLMLWQEFIVGSLFGWFNLDGSRRYHQAYIAVGKKNGKSTFSAGVGLLMAFFDNEAGAEVYAAATKKDQAKIVWGEASRMVKRSEFLRRKIQVLTNNLSSSESDSFFVPLGQDKDNTDGINTHCAIIDELHAWPKRTLWDTLESSTVARDNWLIFVITTAGFDRASLCREQHDYGKRVLSGTATDDEYFVFIAELDKKDDWRDPKNYIKANPSLGVIVQLPDLIKRRDKAIAIPGNENAFKRYRLNLWTEQAARWLSLDLWDKGGKYFSISKLAGRKCYGALDLGRVKDFSAFVLIFPPIGKEKKAKVVPFFWIPEKSVADRIAAGQSDFSVWVNEGWITTTPGNSTDFRFIEAEILRIAAEFDLREIEYDPWATGELINNLVEEGIELVPHRQGFASMAGPTDELERLLLAEEIQHGGNPVLRWMAENVVVLVDPAENKKPDKARSGDKIDGIVALIMCLTGWLGNPEEDKTSVYETRGALVIG